MTQSPHINSLEDAVAMAAIQATANFVSTRHQIPLSSVISGMSMSHDVAPLVNAAIKQWNEQKANTPAPAPPPPPPKPKPQPAPAPVRVPQPVPQQPISVMQNPAAYAIQALKGSVRALEDGPLPAPSTFSATEFASVPEATVINEPAEPASEPAKPEPKKRGRPKKS